MFSGEQTHCRSLCAASIGWAFPAAAWPIWMGILLLVWEKAGQLLALFAFLLSSPGDPSPSPLPRRGLEKDCGVPAGLPMGKEQGRPKKMLSPLPAPSSCIAHSVVKVANPRLERALTSENGKGEC